MSLMKTYGLFSRCIFHATNEDEKQDIIKAFGSVPQIIIAQNLPEKKSLAYIEKEKNTGSLQIVSVGRIAPEKNTLFAIKTLETVTSNVTFDIYGPIYDTNYWNLCEQSINQLPPNIVVNYMRELSHDKIDNVLAKYHVLLLPSTGENFGHVILEAMINSCVPIISDKTPWKNLEEKNIGFDLPLDNNSDFSAAIDQLAQSTKEEFNIMAKNAHHFAQETINNEQLIEDYHKLFQLKD